MRVKLEPFLDAKGATYWSAQRVDDNGTPMGSYDGRGATEEVALANLKFLYAAEQLELAAQIAQNKKVDEMKAKIKFIEVKW